MAWRTRTDTSPIGRVLSMLLVVWLVIGVVAAWQRNYFSGSDTNCAKIGTITVTILAGPLNYAGVNPKIDCTLPQPSK
jgi:riboflavin transporter FmnP